MQKADRQPSERHLPVSGYQDVPNVSAPQEYELDTGIDRGELTAGYDVHEVAGRGRLEM